MTVTPKTTRWIIGAAAAAIAGMTAWAVGAPTTGPAAATRPVPSSDRRTLSAKDAAAAAAATAVAIPDLTPKPMSSVYGAVRYRSIFVRGNQSIGETERPPVRTGNAGPVVPPRPEASLVFRGALGVNGRPSALIEDADAHKVYTVQPSGPIARGRVTNITLDDLDYTSGGRVTHVRLGQTLDGTDAAAGADAPPTAAATPGGPTTDPAGTLGNTTNLSPQDILERMRKRRQQESGGK